jgi:hypothetical protein
LTRDTINSFQNNIPPEALSQTFLDAIDITRELGIDYIWIDSLCIIQDDSEDWDKEASLMSTVYGGSLINIAASGAIDGSIGCFFKRADTWRCQVAVAINDEEKFYDVVPFLMYEKRLLRMPLAKRGWALQERMLPRRTLFFTSTEVFWECHQKTSCETFPDGFPAAILYRTYGRKPLRKAWVSKSMWETLVETYSECLLTKGSDKLVAISGLAEQIQHQTKDQYIAGLWREELELQLCWEVSFRPYAINESRVVPYRAPSWSWASVDARIEFPQMTTYSPGCLNIQVLQVQVTMSSPNQFGNCKNGILRLSCDLLIHVTIKISGRGNFILINGVEIEIEIRLDYKNMISEDDEGNHGSDLLYDFLAMPVQGYGAKSWMIGLFLEPTGRQGEFQRAGVFHLTRGERAFSHCVNNSACHAAKEEYYQIRKDKFGRKHYIIILV